MSHKRLPLKVGLKSPPMVGVQQGPVGPCVPGTVLVPFYTCDENGQWVLDYGVPETSGGAPESSSADCGCGKIAEAFAAGYKLGRSA